MLNIPIEADEAFEADEADEADEAWAPPRRGPRPPVASGQNLFRQRPTGNYVTQAQLEAALARVGNQIKENSTAVRTLTGRVEQAQASIRKEQLERKKDAAAIRTDLNQTKELSALMPLLIQPKTVTTTAAVAGIPSGSRVQVASNDSLSMLLPLMLFTSGSSSSSGTQSGGIFGGGDSSMMMLALVLAFSGQGR